MSQSTTNKIKKNNNSFFLDILIVLSAILYIIADFYNEIFPLKYSLIALLIVGIITAIGLLVKNKIIKFLSIILILLLAFAQYYTMDGLNKVLGKKGNEEHTVSVIVTKESGLKTYEDLNNKTLLKSNSLNNTLYDKFKELIKGKVKFSSIENFDDDVAAAQKLLENGSKVLVLDEASRSFILDEIPDFNDRTFIIDSFSEEIKNDVSNEPAEPEDPVEPIPPLDMNDPEIAEIIKEGNNSNVDKNPNDNVAVPAKSKDSFTILISGIDVRGPVSSVSRSDVNILMTVNSRTKKILTVSVPRDSYIPISCFGNAKDKLTHAGLKGARCTQTTLANYFGVRVDYYMKVNFSSVIRILNTIGNVNVYSHYTFIGYEGSRFVKGMNNVNGTKALEFARTRKTVPGGDFTRGMHQQELIKAVFFKLTSPSNIFNLNNIIDSVSGSIVSNIPNSEISRLISQQLDSEAKWSFSTYNVTGSSGMKTTYLYPKQKLYVFYPSGKSRSTVRYLINSMK